MTLHRAMPLLIPKVRIDGVDNCRYDAQSNRYNFWSSISRLSSCRGGCPCGPRADTSRLIDRNDVAVHVVLESPRWMPISKCYFLGKIKWLSSRKPCTRMSDEAVRSVALGLLVVLSGMGGMGVAATT
ncbi:hypothetical protein BHM03_00003274 [Ensete ventricosum]|nr:hypothetical protein BHM03_00003274 [Ensete ventricosum]